MKRQRVYSVSNLGYRIRDIWILWGDPMTEITITNFNGQSRFYVLPVENVIDLVSKLELVLIYQKISDYGENPYESRQMYQEFRVR